MNRDLLLRLQDRRTAGIPVALATDVASGSACLVSEGDVEGEGRDQLDVDGLANVRRMLADDRNGLIIHAGREIFVRVYAPPRRLIIVGAVPIAEALAVMAHLIGDHVTVVDPRQGVVEGRRFSTAPVHIEWPDSALTALRPDARTAVACLSHDPKLDDPALLAALPSAAYYIGALGSRRSQAARVERLRQMGLDDHHLARLRGPIGLAIGAKTAAEIAVSILAEMVEVRRLGPLGA